MRLGSSLARRRGGRGRRPSQAAARSKKRGWRFNGQQFPNAIHMCVTRPQTQPGVVDLFRDDLAAAVAYATDPASEAPKSSGVYGGIHELDSDAKESLRRALYRYMDTCQGLPRGY